MQEALEARDAPCEKFHGDMSESARSRNRYRRLNRQFGKVSKLMKSDVGEEDHSGPIEVKEATRGGGGGAARCR